jgi:hypothetical protein
MADAKANAEVEDRKRAIILMMATAGLVTSAALFLLMVATSATAAVLHLPEVYWSDSSTRHNLYGVLIIVGLLGSVVAVPSALMSFGFYRAARKRAGTPPGMAALIGAAAGAAAALGVAAAILLTP